MSICFSWINLTPFSHLFHWMFTVFPDTGMQKIQENDVQEVKMQGKFNKKKIIRIAVIAGVVVIVLAGGGTVIAGKVKTRTATETVADTNRSYEVKTGTISTTVSGTGTLAANDVQDIDVLSLLTVDKVYVDAGDTVKAGDLLATVDTVSVKTALQTLQKELSSLDSQIEDAKDDTVSTKIKSSVSGRVKKINAAKGDGVTDVMQEDGALALISLDGKMAVEITAASEVSVGDDVTVTLSDGSTLDGTVESVSGTKVIVTMTDNGPEYGEKVTVSQDGTVLGTGALYIHSELTVTGYTGTVSSVSVKENQKVSDGTVLFKLKDTGKTATYEKLVAQRAEVADALSQVVALYQDPNLYAEFSGTVQSVNCEDAELVTEDVSTADTETAQDTGASSDTKADTSYTEKEQDNSAQAGTEAATDSGVKGTAAQRTTQGSTGGFVSLGCSTVSGGFVQVSADTSVQSTQQDSAAQSAVETQTAAENSGQTQTTEKTAESDSGETGSSTESNTDNTGSGSSTENNGDNTGSSADATEDTVVSTLQDVTVTAPVTGNAVQSEISSGTGYSVSISWNPAVSGTYAAGTAYTATLTYKASDKYCFDGNLAESYRKSVTADNAETKAEVSADGKTLTITAAFAATAQDTQAAQSGAAGLTAQAKGSQMSGGMSGSASGGYRVSSAGASSDSSTEDSETETENLDTYTATTAAFTISRDEKMCVSVSVDEQDILNLSVGQTAEVTLDAVDGETFEGTVTSVNTVSSEAANGVTKYTAEVSLDKTDQMLAGMNASVVVTVSSAENCLIVPEAALQEDGNKTTVYTTYDASTGTYGGETEVTTGVSDGTSVEIVSGLSEGDTVYYSYTESSSDTMGFGMDMGNMQMPGGGAPDGQDRSGGNGNGNGPQGGPGGGDRQ